MKRLILLACLLWPGLLSAQAVGPKINNREAADAVAVKCLNAAGTGFEACAGAGGGLSAVVTAQLAVTASAQQLGSNAGRMVCIKVLDGGTRNVYFGPSGVATSTGMELIPGETACRSASNSNLFFVIAAGTGSTVAYEIWD